MMRDICNTVLVLDRGRMVTMGPVGEAIRTFRERLIESGFAPPPEPDVAEGGATGAAPVEIAPHRRQVKITNATVEYARQEERPYIETGEPIAIHVGFAVATPIVGVRFKITLVTESESIVFSSTSGGPIEEMALDPGHGTVTFWFDSMSLLDGRFGVVVEARDSGGVVLDILDPACHFEVMNPGRAVGIVGLPMRVEITPPGAWPADGAATALP
jgi:hypothetical protein